MKRDKEITWIFILAILVIIFAIVVIFWLPGRQPNRPTATPIFTAWWTPSPSPTSTIPNATVIVKPTRMPTITPTITYSSTIQIPTKSITPTVTVTPILPIEITPKPIRSKDISGLYCTCKPKPWYHNDYCYWKCCYRIK